MPLIHASPAMAVTTYIANFVFSFPRCWLQESSLQWIVFGPIVITIVVSTLVLSEHNRHI